MHFSSCLASLPGARCQQRAQTRHTMQSATQQHEHSTPAASQQQQQLMQQLTDAHCHPQLDPAHLQAVLGLHSHKLAAMSVSYDVDWDIMLQLHKLAGACVSAWDAPDSQEGPLWKAAACN